MNQYQCLSFVILVCISCIPLGKCRQRFGKVVSVLAGMAVIPARILSMVIAICLFVGLLRGLIDCMF